MNYTVITKNDFDRIYKNGEKSFLCYSMKKVKELSPDGNYNIVGLTREYNGVDEYSVDLGKDKMSVIPTERSNPRYKTIGYIPVEGEDGDFEYIAVQKSRNVISAQIAVIMQKFRHNAQF